ncbi:hypothetical protein NVIE_1289 [Nitrososphaera viennensis EN76]|uniref:Uncharacterized protein n=2 Tax=Nitrososphaera viennensis TaxID=1034015 RepID=A0A060HQR1_9ARCH|nr:hypothetical protein NVIE_1289 [Nitrososphaera viennensis EN76]
MQSPHTAGSLLTPIFHVIRTSKYRTIAIASGLAYAIIYMVTVGIVSYVPNLSSATGIPVFRATYLGISAIPTDNVFFFIFYGALAFLAASSILVGINTALMFYSRRLAKACGTRKRPESKGLFGLVPAFFTSFSCCGGGLLALAIGPTAFSSLSIYSKYMAPLTVAVLAAGTYLMSRKISKMERS